MWWLKFKKKSCTVGQLMTSAPEVCVSGVCTRPMAPTHRERVPAPPPQWLMGETIAPLWANRWLIIKLDKRNHHILVLKQSGDGSHCVPLEANWRDISWRGDPRSAATETYGGVSCQWAVRRHVDVLSNTDVMLQPTAWMEKPLLWLRF